VPNVTLRVLGGDGAPQRVAGDALFAQAGVEVLPHRDDVPEMLLSCALTVNPLRGIRGSAVKLIESLMAGRICISTAEGARGFADRRLDALAIVPDVQDMAEPIVRLLNDGATRHRREVPDREALAQFEWPQCAALQRDLWLSLL